MSSAFILQQAKAFGPGRLTGVFRDYGIPIQHRKLFAGDEVPSDLEEIRCVILLGGPMHVSDIGGTQYPFLEKEVALLQRVIAHDRPVLAIGLGAQLLAHAAGAKVSAAEAPEFGWHPVKFPFPGGTEPMVMGMTDGAPMFHSHTDTFELPKLPGVPPAPTGSSLLSSSKLCKNQAFRFKNRMFGFQYHFELNVADIEAIVAAGKEEAAKALGAEGEAQIRAGTEQHFSRYARLGDRIMRNFVQFTHTY